MIPLKGFVLSTSLYEDIGQRAMVDLDVLAAAQDLTAVAAALESLGYVQMETPLDAFAGQRGLPAKGLRVAKAKIQGL